MEVINRDSVQPFITKDTSEIREILAPRNSSIKNQSLAEATVAPGKSTEEHHHPITEEIYYILHGNGTMTIDDIASEVTKGDAIAILPGKRHKIHNTGECELVFLCCCSPAYSHEDTVLLDESLRRTE